MSKTKQVKKLTLTEQATIGVLLTVRDYEESVEITIKASSGRVPDDYVDMLAIAVLTFEVIHDRIVCYVDYVDQTFATQHKIFKTARHQDISDLIYTDISSLCAELLHLDKSSTDIFKKNLILLVNNTSIQDI
jgi:hypothetical protein